MSQCFEDSVLDHNVEEDVLKIILRIIRGLGTFSRFMSEMNPQEPFFSEGKDMAHNLPEERIRKNEGQCLICLKEYVKDEFVRKMPCNHAFHSTCLLTWLERSNSCPLCRCELATESLE